MKTRPKSPSKRKPGIRVLPKAEMYSKDRKLKNEIKEIKAEEEIKKEIRIKNRLELADEPDEDQT